MPKISVIVCSIKNPEWTLHEKHIAQTIGVDFEYIRIDNRGNPYSLAGAYEVGQRRAVGEILVFVHEDVFFVERNWGQVLYHKFQNPEVVGVGVAGSQVLLPEQPSWVTAGRPWIKGRVLHHNLTQNRYTLCHYSPKEENQDQAVVVLDGLFMAYRADIARMVGWDSTQFDGFHLYDMDFSLRASDCGQILVTQDIMLLHQSAGHFDQIWWKYAERFTIKHFSRLPVVLDSSFTPLNPRISFESEDLSELCQNLWQNIQQSVC